MRITNGTRTFEMDIDKDAATIERLTAHEGYYEVVEGEEAPAEAKKAKKAKIVIAEPTEEAPAAEAEPVDDPELIIEDN